MKAAIVVSGLPASGKSTIGRKIARALSWECLDKDDFLEQLYEERGVSSWSERKRLSRESDVLFRQQAEQKDAVVLVSHWRPTTGLGDSGTQTDWLSTSFDNIVEINCLCEPKIANGRFFARQRHRGHLDQQRDRSAHLQRLQELAKAYPLNLGPLVQVNTEEAVELTSLLAELFTHLE